MIQIQNLSYYYNPKYTAVLNNITADIGAGVYLMLGENGAGKTTLLRLISSALLPSSGSILVNGDNSNLRLPSYTGSVVYLGLDTTTFFRDLTEMVHYHACFYPNFDPAMLRRNLEAFGIDMRQKLSSMSMGTRHKALLAYYISLRTEVLLLDEPANGLDIESKDILLRMIAECMSEESTVIVSTHTVSDLANLYDGLMVLQAGTLRLSALTDDIMERVAFVSGYNAAPGALYSEWSAGKMVSLVPAETADDLDMQIGNIDYRVLYRALHSPAATAVLEHLSADKNIKTNTSIFHNHE